MRRCKKSLRTMIIEDCLQMGDFPLSSGGRSNYFIDLSKVYLSGHGAYLIGKTIHHHTKDVKFDAIGGPSMGAMPLAAVTVVRYWKRQRQIKEGFWVRSAKTTQIVEGRITRMHKAIVIEDVCTTGASAARAVQAVREVVGCEVVRVVALVDREEGARERFEEMGIIFDPIFTARKLLEYADNGTHRIAADIITGNSKKEEKSQRSDSIV